MWKCLNRGVWETIDRGVSVFKTDTSRGTSLISSLTKDIDEISIKTNVKHECSIISKHQTKLSDATVEPTLQHESHSRKQVLDQGKFNACGSSNDLLLDRDCSAKSSPPTSQGFRHSSNISEIIVPNDVQVQSCSHFAGHSGIECTKSGRKTGWRKPSGRRPSWFSPSVRLCDSPPMLLETSKFKHTHSLASNTLNIDPPEGNDNSAPLISANEFQKLKTSDKFSSAENDISVLSWNHNLGRNSTSNNSQQLISNEKSTYCLLKLPFLCYEVGHSSSWHKFCAGWSVKSRREFEKGNDGRSDGNKNGESEETKENAWKYYEMHQSFLEAIGWSSALLFGWFFGQRRMRLMITDAQRERDNKHKNKCCIMGSMTRLFRLWSSQQFKPLNVLPSESDGVHRRENDVQSNENGRKVKNESSLVMEEAPLFNDSFPHEMPEASLYQSHVFAHKMPSINASVRNAIPMPWHAVVSENLPFGPITLEEAIKEAGKGLEEAQSEVLLALALEKLDTASDLSVDEPSASELLQSAASLGNAAAAFNLGICYEKGVGGVAKNLIKAYHWYKLASDKGHAAATYNLAVFHANGLAGLNPNTSLANQLLMKASSLGLPEAMEALSYLSYLGKSDSSYGCEDDAVLGTSDAISNPNQRESVITPDPSTSTSLQQSWEVSSTEFTNNASYLRYNNNSLGENTTKSSVNHSKSVESNSLEHGNELRRSSQVKLDHFFKSFGLLAGGEEFLSDVLHDNIYNLKNRDMESNSVQLLAH